MSLLHRHAVQTVVDVREVPLSRKPGFSKKTLSDTLKICGLQYVHIPKLGCPKPIRHRYRDDGDWAQYTASFLKQTRGHRLRRTSPF